MRTKVILALALALVWCAGSAYAQQPPLGLTFVSDYHVRPGKEVDFMQLVKTVGEPVRDKLMAEGVIMAWGIDTPLMRAPGQPNYSIWYAVANLNGVQQVQDAIRAQLRKLADEEKKAADDARKKGGKGAKTTAERIQEVYELDKTKDWFFRDVLANFSSAPPPAGLLSYTWIETDRVLPGKGPEYRQLFEKYDKPILDKLLADGTLGAYGLSVEEVRTTDSFTHFLWVSVPNLAAADKINAAFEAAFSKRSDEERAQIRQHYFSLVDAPANRSFVLRAVIFKVGGPPPKK